MSGTETRSKTQTTSYSTVGYWCNRSGGYSYPDTKGVFTSEIMSRTSNNTPNIAWYRKNRILLPQNGFSFSRVRYSPVTGKRTSHTCCQGCFDPGYGTETGTWAYIGNFPISLITAGTKQSCDTKAAAKLLSNVKNSSINVAVASAEAHKTFSMISQTATKLVTSFRALKKGNITKAYNELGLSPYKRERKAFNKRFSTDPKIAAENEWLAMRFGWVPLLNDIHGAAEALANAAIPVTRNRVESQSTMTLNDNPTVPWNGGLGWQTKHKIVSRHTSKYVCYFQDSNTAPTMNTLGFTNPAALAWELLPFSFVVDWFLPVGTYLENLDATIGSTFIGGCKTHFTIDECRWTATGAKSLPNDPNFWDGNMEQTKTEVNVVRIGITSFPRNTFPEFKSPLSVTHAIDAIALLKQIFK